MVKDDYVMISSVTSLILFLDPMYQNSHLKGALENPAGGKIKFLMK